MDFLTKEISLLDEVSLDYLEIFEQKPLSAVSDRKWRLVKRLSNETQYRYLRYYLVSSIRKWIPFLFALYIDRVRLPTAKAKQKLSIEHAVTSKHLRALEAGASHDFVVVIEDDAILNSRVADTGATIRFLFEKGSRNPGTATYIDFAGGFDLAEVSPKAKHIQECGSYVSSLKLFTNTACGYAMSSSLTNMVLNEVRENQWLSWLGIDFLFNRVFHKYPPTHPVSCYHLTQSRISHGSLTGAYKSWENFLR